MFDPWKRSRALRHLSAGLTTHLDAVLDALVADTEIARRVALGHEVEPALALLDLLHPDSVFPFHPALRTGERGPLGTVAIVLPSNAPLTTLVRAVGSAFVAGNIEVLVCVPPGLRQLAQVVEPMITRSLPGVRFVREEVDPFVERCLADPYCRALFAAGDPGWMTRFRAQARASQTRVIFEGHGNDAFLVLPGADVEAVADAAAVGVTLGVAGNPMATQRIHVHASLEQALADALVARLVDLPAGPVNDPDTVIGPVRTHDALAQVRWQLDDAQQRGATLRCGGVYETIAGNRHETLHATLLTRCTPLMAVVQEPTPGPVLAMVPFETDDEAVHMVTEPLVGYSAAVWGGSQEHADALVRAFGQVLRNRAPFAPEQRELWYDWGGYGRTSWVWELQAGQFVQLAGPRQLMLEFSRPLEGTARAA